MEVSPTIQNNFQALVDLLVSTNHERRRNIDPLIERALSPSFYLKEFCTIRANIGRCTGKSNYIMRRANDSDCIIVDRSETASWYKEEGFKNVFKWYPEAFRGMKHKFNAVYVDEPSYCFINQFELDRFYNLMASYKAHTIVMLGA